MSDKENVVSHGHNIAFKPSRIELVGAINEGEPNQCEGSGSANK